MYEVRAAARGLERPDPADREAVHQVGWLLIDATALSVSALEVVFSLGNIGCSARVGRRLKLLRILRIFRLGASLTCCAPRV